MGRSFISQQLLYKLGEPGPPQACSAAETRGRGNQSQECRAEASPDNWDPSCDIR